MSQDLPPDPAAGPRITSITFGEPKEFVDPMNLETAQLAVMDFKISGASATRGETQVVKLPHGSQMMYATADGEDIRIWALVVTNYPDDEAWDDEHRGFIVYGNGPIGHKLNHARYMITSHSPEQTIHVFESLCVHPKTGDVDTKPIRR